MLFTMLAGAAVVFDYYFEHHPEVLPLDELRDENKNTSEEHGTIYLISQVNTFSAKTAVQKTPFRKVPDAAHNKFLQQCHQMQNLQAMKTKIVIPQKQKYISQFLTNTRQCYFQHPDDEHHIS